MDDDKKTLKFQMMMTPKEAEMLDDWMFKNRVRSRAEAIRRLWQIGLEFDRDTERLSALCGEALGISSQLGELLAASNGEQSEAVADYVRDNAAGAYVLLAELAEITNRHIQCTAPLRSPMNVDRALELMEMLKSSYDKISFSLKAYM